MIKQFTKDEVLNAIAMGYYTWYTGVAIVFMDPDPENPEPKQLQYDLVSGETTLYGN